LLLTRILPYFCGDSQLLLDYSAREGKRRFSCVAQLSYGRLFNVIKLPLFAAGILLLATSALAQQSAAGNTEPATPAPDCAALLPAMQKQLDWDTGRLRDWAQLDRYREANAALAHPAKDEIRVVFMGDSITDGWSKPEFGGFFPGKPYVNRGISGQTTPQMLVRFRLDVIDLEPQVVVILAGTNDIAGNTGPITLEQIEGNLTSMAELGRAHGIRVVLSSVMPVRDGLSDKDGERLVQTKKRPPERISTLNEWIKKYAAANHLVYLDYFSAMVDDQGFLKAETTYDGLHPNAHGYVVMAPLAEKAIQASLKLKP
jgi:lysophospholipase L1-like esterase